MKLMIPGPTEISPESLAAMAQPITPHYGQQWGLFYNQTIEKLKKIFKTKNDILVYAGTGSAAIESAICSLIEPGDKVAICHNGYFSHRIIDMVKNWDGIPVIIESPLNQGVNPADVKTALKSNGEIKLLIVVHVETSTGVENDIKSICKEASDLGITILVDAVASLGGSDLPGDEWGIDLIATSSQKCLEGPTGLGFLSISEKALNQIRNRKTKVKGWYLNINNIRAYQEKWASWHGHGPNSAPVALYKALNVSLDKILLETMPTRIARHSKISNATKATLKEMGLELFATPTSACKTLTSFLLPKSIDPQQFKNKMLQEYDILIAGDVGYVNPSLIRLGHMGLCASSDHLQETFKAIEASLTSLNHELPSKNADQIFKNILENSRA